MRITIILSLVCLASVGVYASDELLKIRSDISKEGLSWVAGETRIFRMKPSERRGLLSPTPPEIEKTNVFVAGRTAYAHPSVFDYRNYAGYNWMTPVRDQRDCGGCWAFSTLGSLEAMIRLYYSDPDMDLDLSEQDLISCTVTGSCTYGGSQLFAANYIKASGVVDEDCFPYIAQEGDCKNKCSNPQRREFIKDAGAVGFLSIAGEEDIKAALLKYGPIPSSMKVYSDFYSYQGGVYQKTSNATEEGWHAIVIVGWDDVRDAWICKNSWGDDFGENGYFMIKKGNSFIGWGTVWMLYKDDLKPRLCSDTPSVNLTVDLSASPRKDFEVSIYNCGSWVIEWLSYTTDSYVQILKRSGVAIKRPEIVRASLDASSLSAGTYTTYIGFKADGVENSPLVIPVRITVVDNEPPDAGVDILIPDTMSDVIFYDVSDILELTDINLVETLEDTLSGMDSEGLQDLSSATDIQNHDSGDQRDILSVEDVISASDSTSLIKNGDESSSGCSCSLIW